MAFNVLKQEEEKIIDSDLLVSIAILSPYAVLIIQYFILFFFKISDASIVSRIQLLSKVIVGLLFIISFPVVIKRNLLLFVSTYLIGIVLFLCNFIIFPKNSEALMSVAFPFFFSCLPCFIYSYNINDKNLFLKITFKISNIVFVVGALIGLLVFTNRMSIDNYSMSLSYYMLLPAIADTYKFSISKKVGYIVKIFISVAIIVGYGSRGATMCFALYVILVFLKKMKISTYALLLKYSSIFFLCIIVIINIKNILLFIYILSLKFGLNSRTLYLLSQGGLELSGRGAIYDAILDSIFSNPLIGIGIAGDRVITGAYSHNIFIELLSGFGIIIGTIIILYIFYVCYNTLNNKNGVNSNIILIWFSLGFLFLLVSGTYLTEFVFWIFMGLSIRDLHSHKRTKSKTVNSIGLRQSTSATQ